jgi:hypothetical protein
LSFSFRRHRQRRCEFNASDWSASFAGGKTGPSGKEEGRIPICTQRARATKSSAPTETLDLFYFSHVPSPGVPGGPQRPKNGQTQNPLSCLVANSPSCLELEMIEFGRRDAAMKNSAPAANSKKYLAQSSTSLTLKLDLLISDAAIAQTITGSRAPKMNI